MSSRLLRKGNGGLYSGPFEVSHVYGIGVFLNLYRKWLRWNPGSQRKIMVSTALSPSGALTAVSRSLCSRAGSSGPLWGKS